MAFVCSRLFFLKAATSVLAHNLAIFFSGFPIQASLQVQKPLGFLIPDPVDCVYYYISKVQVVLVVFNIPPVFQ